MVFEQKETLILAIDTSGAYVSLAVMTPQEIVGQWHQDMDRGQGENLIPAIDRLMQQCGCSFQDLSAVAVAVGPGSFTGVRIALATAKGFGLALGIPVWGVTNFEALAQGIGQPVRVILDTKRGDFYVQDFDAASMPINDPSIMSCDDFKKEKKCVSAIGDGALTASEFGCIDVISAVHKPAVGVGYVALGRINQPLSAEPLYLRDADVTVSN